MKGIKLLSSGLFFALVLNISNANAFVIDTLLTSDSLGNSGDAAEKSFVETESGINLIMDFKIEDPNITAVYDTTNNHWSIDISTLNATPDYFLLKFGVGQTGIDSHYVFENIPELDKLVWSNSQVNNLTSSTDFGRLSHFAGFSADFVVTNVPEPISLALLGTGIMGMAFIRRRK